jgi:5-methyltetrahydropteroyltriglutamate--homocysteine methyltransferase
MKLSMDRILTTHVGSLPRPPSVVDLLVRRERGEAYDRQEFDRVIGGAVADTVARQAEIGIDVVSDGEMSKLNYATYIKNRLAGFGGDNTPKPHRDLRDYPEFRKKQSLVMGQQPFRRFSCVGPVAMNDMQPLQDDIAHLRAALAKTKVADGFMNAASPGVISAFQPNKFYPSHDAYVDAIAEAMRPEYEAIVAAGLVLQVDCPDLAMSRHTAFQDLSDAEYLTRAEHQVEALNHALRNVPAHSVRLHICWGNYEGPHDFDIALEKILPYVRKVKPQVISFEASNARHAHEWAVWKEAKLPDDKVLMVGCLDTCTNFVEHPELVAQRICRFADFVGRERVLAGTDCGMSTSAGYSILDPQIAFKKLKSLVDGAAIASDRLWQRTTARSRTG